MKTPLKTPTLRQLWRHPIHFMACGFGIGAIPFAPGTFGTIAGVIVYLLLYQLPLWGYLTLTALLILVGIPLCQITNRDFGTTDHPAAVWDEIATFPIVMTAVPFTWYYLLLGFVLFRFFDIFKPGIIGWTDRNVHGGIGVMLDDMIAAVHALIILQIIIHFLI